MHAPDTRSPAPGLAGAGNAMAVYSPRVFLPLIGEIRKNQL